MLQRLPSALQMLIRGTLHMLNSHLLKGLIDAMAKLMIIFMVDSIFEFTADCESSFTL